METKRFAIVGTDARQAAAGRALERAGCAVSGAEQVARADCILLPLPLDESRPPLAAQRLGLRAIHALSLPAVCAPETAGEAVARTVLAILREREECT